MRRRAEGTRQRILDSAEALFSQNGYHAVSLADIAAAAPVRVALLHYHFGTKEELFAAVIDRRAAENVTGLEAALDTALVTQGSPAERRAAIIQAFVAPVVEKSMRGGEGWKNYIRLLARLANLPQEESFLSPYRNSFDDIVDAYVRALRALHPDMVPEDVNWAFYFLQAATTHVLVESGVLDRQTGGALRSSDLDRVTEKLVAFCTAGFEAFIPHPRPRS
ncbi:TetR/AcrR family transcriptional regulator [Sphingomonas sp. DBB INV C78]|uniref:TetR/AcrR family transcriptional regulator n=1 Tax=Sphingomonas sp. DBB INV C78 TaxID=3349434 RepID=UPI0036D43CBE